MPVDNAHVTEVRAKWIKWLRQHDGMAREKKDVPYEFFGVTSHSGLVELMSLGVRYDASLEVQAIGNALHLPGLSKDSNSVIARRRSFASDHAISLSTVERLEDKGATKLAEVMPILVTRDTVMREFERMDDRLVVLDDLMMFYGERLDVQTLGEVRLRLAILRNQAERSLAWTDD